jgi:SAM-dependent methyltransferase
MANETAIDMQKLEKFLNQVVGDVGSSMSAALVVVGDRLGFWRTLRQGPLTSTELAAKAECAERYCREWLNAQASAGYLAYDAATGKYTLPTEQGVALGDPDSPAFVPGLFQVTQAIWAAIPQMIDRFKTGDGYSWGEHHPCLFEGTERFFRSGYIGNLVSSWLPALEGVTAKLERGAKVADVGCGLGASTILMAQAYPNSTFIGFDSHPGSIEMARKRAQAAGVANRVKFEVAKSTDFPGSGYDLVACFDCLHDMEDPAGASRWVRKSLAPDGTFLVVEPAANDKAEDNHNPIGRVFYSASTMLCVPHSLSQKGPALGACAGEARLRKVIVDQGGFRKFRRATQTPFNLVLEARP